MDTNYIEKNERAMKVLEDMLKECAKELMSLDIPIRIDRVRGIHLISLKNTLAGCYYRESSGGSEFIIAIHTSFVKYMDDPAVLENVRNSIRHELIHTCANTQEHNGTWLYWANKCDKILGSSTRIFMEEEIYYNIHDVAPFIYRCDECGFEYHSTRNDFEEIHCDICNNDLHLL